MVFACPWHPEEERVPLVTFYTAGSVPYRGSIAPAVRHDANEALRDANEFPTKSPGREPKDV